MMVVLRQRYCILLVENTRVEIVVKDLLTQKNHRRLMQLRMRELERLENLMQSSSEQVCESGTKYIQA
jgi:hypothetical protein